MKNYQEVLKEGAELLCTLFPKTEKQPVKKITIATVKKFIRDNEGELYVQFLSSFDGMTDGLEFVKERKFELAEKTDKNIKYSLGINGLYFVGRSRDYLSHFENEEFKGIHVFNSCGSFDISIKK